MNDVETRLRDALDARAELVQPEHLSPTPPVVDLPPPWWHRTGPLLAMAAVAVLAIALPLLALVVTGGPKKTGDRDDIATSGPTGRTMADVDGDGETDEVRVQADAIEVALSGSGTTVQHPMGADNGVALAATANVDGRKGEEIIAVVDPESVDLHRAAPVVLSLRDGELVPVVDYAFGTGGAPGDEGTLTYWWIHDAELMWWRSQEPVTDGSTPYAVDAVRFAGGDQLRAVDNGTWCVVETAPTELNDCEGGAPEQAWYDQHPDGLPETWSEQQGVEAGEWLDGDLDGDGTQDQVRISGSEGNASLQIEAGGDSLTTLLDGPTSLLGPLTQIDGSDTVVIPVAVAEGAAGTTYTTWHLYLVRGGEVVEATTPPTPSFGSQTSNLPETDGGRDTWRTWVDPSGGIYSMAYDDQGTPITDDGYPGSASYVYRNTFYRWTLDGTTLTAAEIGQGCTVKGETAIYGCP